MTPFAGVYTSGSADGFNLPAKLDGILQCVSFRRSPPREKRKSPISITKNQGSATLDEGPEQLTESVDEASQQAARKELAKTPLVARFPPAKIGSPSLKSRLQMTVHSGELADR
jgi:hypothetical protein